MDYINHLKSRKTILKAELADLDRALQTARAAEEDGYKVNESFLSALQERRQEITGNLSAVDADLRALINYNREQAAREVR
jgi:aminopeptidase N